MSDIPAIDFNEVRSTTADVRAAMIEMSAEPYPGPKSLFPQVWCEWASIALAEVLAHRGLGDWTFVTAGDIDNLSGHAWLELRGGQAHPVVTIDITLDQFSEWSAPFVGEGRTPALERFPTPRYAGPWTEWPVLEHDESFERYAAAMLAHLRER